MTKKHALAFLAAVFIFKIGAIKQATAQTTSKDIIIRSGFSFSKYSDRFSTVFQATPNPEETHQSTFKKSSYYFTPGVGKFLGKGYYLGAQMVIGQSKINHTILNENNESILHADTDLDRIGGGVLFRKYFTLSGKLSPFAGLSANFYREKGTTMGYSGQSVMRKTNYIASEIHVGVNYMILPRLGIEAYYSPGRFYGEKNAYADENGYDYEVDFGKTGQEFSFGINYHLVKY
ncbi:hypothetical protein [Echinicola vietnamensis]|uniref:Outer membrane protein beta-barrel domain-containing protein n=1 Tax=Echinicola vietnamensis (strain DSM 17526 / LMG 23754 / KMM 6221) TaxID=926556 RepID=L0G4J0_ECHVK|nr:hypothetical protein [Echinicola vietnamensis]AGA79745.1 hypothetical protein Echvi_3529 [Echinicola vietnamensis DSM 17526]